MYSGLLPKGLSLTDAELSSDDEDDQSVVKTQEIESISKCLAEPSRAGVGESCESVVKTGSPCTPPVIEDLNPQDYSLPGISHQMWQKFKGLQKKNDEVKMKLPRRRQQRKGRHQKDNELQSRTIESNKDREPQVEHEKLWDGLEQYFGINDKFHPPACSKPYPKSGLEKSIESAIAEGDFGKAEEMSDRLATRELAVKIAQAADCRDFVQSKQEAGASQAAQKRKEQIAWGFEAKRRWETKSNMGYM